jgi:hypothetical protein
VQDTGITRHPGNQLLNCVFLTLKTTTVKVVVHLEGGTLETNARIEDKWMPPQSSEARDEMNLAEFPLCALTDRLSPEVKTLRFEDRQWDKGRNAFITRQLTVTGSDAYGLPTKLDDEILLGLIQLTRQRGFADRKVPFTRHELIRLLGWRDETKNYQRIEASLNRWTGVTLYYNKAWWNKERQCWMDEKFHILDNVWLCHRNEPAPDTGLPMRGAPMSAFVWNEVMFRSFCQGNLKGIDFDFFQSLKSAVAKRLYRFLDKRFYYRSRCKLDLRELCCEHVGLSRNYDTANLKRKILSGVRELEERGFLRPLVSSQRFVKIRRGEWQIIVERADPKLVVENGETAVTTHPLVESLIQRGVRLKIAKQTVGDFPARQIETQIRAFDWLRQTDNVRISRNPAGYLVSAIKHNYSLPKGIASPLGKNPVTSVCPPDQRQPVRRRVRAAITVHDPHGKAVAQYWAALSAENKLQAEAEAMKTADSFSRELFERGGTFATAARNNILDAYARKQLGQ